MTTQNMIFFERLVKEFDTLFDYNFQEGPKLKLFNINIIQSKYGTSIYQTYHIIKNTIQEYWGTKTKYEVKFHKSPFPLDTPFENILFMDANIIGEEPKTFKPHMENTQITGLETSYTSMCKLDMTFNTLPYISVDT